MLRCRALLTALLLVNLSGCLGLGSRSTASLFQRFRKQQDAPSPEVVHLDVALVQIPLGDTALHRGLWDFLDEQVVPLEKKGVLEQNGFRIGRVGNTAPQELLDLVTNRRHCPDPRQVRMPPGKGERLIELGPPLKEIAFDLCQGDQSSRVALDGGHYAFAISPSLTGDGRTRLRFVPRVKHSGWSNLPWKPSSDRSGWTMQFEKACESFPALEWDVVLAPGEYLVIGAREDRPRTFGYEALVRRDERVPTKRLLVLRAWRPADAPRPSDEENGSSTEPLAVQAARSSIRGVSP
jgi:hypothetical protein